MTSELEKSVQDGSTLMVTDVNINKLIDDMRFKDILRKRELFLTSKAPFRVMVCQYFVHLSMTLFWHGSPVFSSQLAH